MISKERKGRVCTPDPHFSYRREGGVRHEQFTNSTISEIRHHRRRHDAGADAMKAKCTGDQPTCRNVFEPGSQEERAYLGLHRNVDLLINQALEIIKPNAAEKIWCRTNVVWSIRGVIDAARIISSKEKRDKLADVAQSLRKIRSGIEKNAPYLLIPLPLSPIPMPFPPNALGKWRQEYEKREKDLNRRRLLLESFLKELDRSLVRVDQLTKDARPKRSGGRKDNRKRDAAVNAFILLRAFGRKRPTLTVGGEFPRLADTLYKAATGKNADLYSQCRALFESIRGSGSKWS